VGSSALLGVYTWSVGYRGFWRISAALQAKDISERRISAQLLSASAASRFGNGKQRTKMAIRQAQKLAPVAKISKRVGRAEMKAK